jgi:hypothetical protein
MGESQRRHQRHQRLAAEAIAVQLKLFARLNVPMPAIDQIAEQNRATGVS